jgi:hypothetical protein
MSAAGVNKHFDFRNLLISNNVYKTMIFIVVSQFNYGFVVFIYAQFNDCIFQTYQS